ncbi:phosphotransferase [Rapidithrix thailandica]|uniref:Phosphotransferase n=1 Tax=Rapidithrix thailandica TaxID=413964 RepID=A0AAW9SK31_9BACT
MNHFPAISSTLSPVALAQRLIELYGFSENTTCNVLRLGINHTYLITDAQEKYVLRVYHLHWRTEEEIMAELELLNLLKANDILVSYPIRDKKSAYIQRFNAWEGERLAVVFSYAQGQTVRNPSDKTCFQLGLEMAKMHRVTTGKKLNRKTYNAQTLAGWAFQALKERFPMSLKEMQYIDRANSMIASQFAQADLNQIRTGAVHLDVWYDNMKIKDESEITIFDFDNCGNGWLLLDIAYSLMLLFKNEPNKEIFNQKMNRFYQGYQSISGISQEEKRMIPYGGLAIWLHYSGIHAQRFDDFSNIFLSEDFLKYWIDTVNHWMVFNGIEI